MHSSFIKKYFEVSEQLMLDESAVQQVSLKAASLNGDDIEKIFIAEQTQQLKKMMDNNTTTLFVSDEESKSS